MSTTDVSPPPPNIGGYDTRLIIEWVRGNPTKSKNPDVLYLFGPGTPLAPMRQVSGLEGASGGLSGSAVIHLQWIPPLMNLKNNDIDNDLAEGGTAMTQVNEEPLTFLELYS
ncbi:hypothetical protein TNCV_1315271 [Trichonephila clavipes]|uniref:Uncharacterized protein n=1 Tax=Trichonephila clavipes TaxID=2585209 RepID=A0A8X6SN24_TRICX|nr:hypothetical protein TNCV_1315271 [Trichonephila clavipes]